jgi:hypothetical protein
VNQKGDTIMTGTKNQGLMALLAGALLGVTGCVIEPDVELGRDANELDSADESKAGTASQPPVDPCNTAFSYDPELTIALPRIMDTRANPSSLPDTGWYTNALIQNTSSNLATVRLRALAKPGTGYGGGCTIFSLGSEESVNFRLDNPGLSGTVGIPAIATGNFEGSMLIETDRPLAVVAKLSNTSVPPLGRVGGSASSFYTGLPLKSWGAETGTDLVYPIMKSGFNGSSTTLFVQNVDWFDGYVNLMVRANAPSLSWPYYSQYTYSVFIPAGRSVAIHPSQFLDSIGNPMPAGCSGGANPGQPGARCFGSVEIVPDYWGFGPRVAAVAVEHPASAAVPAILANHFESASHAADQVWLPVVKNQYQGATSGVAIMNLSSAHQDITISLRGKASPSPAYSHTFEDVPPYQSVVASPSAGTFGGFPAGQVGVATVTAAEPIAVVVNESKGSSSVSSYHGQSIPGDLAAPLIKLAFGSPLKSTSVTLWNVGNQAVQIVGSFKCRVANGTSYSNHTHTMTAGANIAVDFQPNNIPAGNLCSAIFTTTQGTLVGTVTEEDVANPSLDSATYEGIALD